jgi:hypothetical protein
MTYETRAPWADVVSDAPFSMTVNELLALPDDGCMYELVDGRLVRMAPKTLEVGDMLDGMDVLLGFSLPVARLFE